MLNFRFQKSIEHIVIFFCLTISALSVLFPILNSGGMFWQDAGRVRNALSHPNQPQEKTEAKGNQLSFEPGRQHPHVFSKGG